MSETTEQTPDATPAAGEGKIKVTKRQPCPCGSGKKFKDCCVGDPRYELITMIGAPAAEPAVAPSAGKAGPGPGNFNKPPKSLPNQRHGNTTHRRRV